MKPDESFRELQDFAATKAGQEVVKEIPQNRDSAPSKLRRGKKHCPVCIAPLQNIVDPESETMV